MPAFNVHIDIEDARRLPDGFEDDLGAAVAEAGGRDFRLAGSGTWPLMPISFVIDADSEHAAADAGAEIVKTIAGSRVIFGVSGVTPAF